MLDFDAFNAEVLDTDAFAREAVYLPSGGSVATIPVILETPYSAPEGVGIAGVSDNAPSALCRTVDAPDAARGDTLTLDVNGTDVTFTVVEAMPDGDGMTTLRLSRE